MITLKYISFVVICSIPFQKSSLQVLLEQSRFTMFESLLQVNYNCDATVRLCCWLHSWELSDEFSSKKMSKYDVICRLGGPYSEKLWPRAWAFSCSRSQFSTIQTDPKPANNMFIFFLQEIGFAADYKWVCLHNFVIELACTPSTNNL